MNEISCDDALMAWMAESDGEKPALSVEELGSHLNSCGDCQRDIEQMLLVDSLLKRQTRRQQDANLWPAVEKRLDSRIVPRIKWAPFVFFGAIFAGIKLFEMLSERPPGLAFKLVPLIFIIGLFVTIKENPFRINAELTAER